MKSLILSSVLLVSSPSVATAFLPRNNQERCRTLLSLQQSSTTSSNDNHHGGEDRRVFLSTIVATTGALATGVLSETPPAQAVGPVKLTLEPINYVAAPCPPSKPIPGEKAMAGMRGLCVTVQANVLEASPKDLAKVGVYGFVVDEETGNSVLANNPDLR